MSSIFERDIVPDSLLPKTYASPVVKFATEELLWCINCLLYNMSTHHGIGLAAPQIGINMRVISVDTRSAGGSWVGVMVNPRITSADGSITYVEGCLSFQPGYTVNTKRHEAIAVSYQDMYGNYMNRKFDGIDAICIQHEIDHLNGLTMEDRRAE